MCAYIENVAVITLALKTSLASTLTVEKKKLILGLICYLGLWAWFVTNLSMAHFVFLVGKFRFV